MSTLSDCSRPLCCDQENALCIRLTRCLVAMNAQWGPVLNRALSSASKAGATVTDVESSMRNRVFVLTAGTNSLCLYEALQSLWCAVGGVSAFRMPVPGEKTSVGAVMQNEKIPGMPPRRVTRVVVDGLNYLSRFFPARSDPVFRWGGDEGRVVLEGRRRVRAFCDAARETGVECIFVFDCGQATAETNAKWTERRLCEVETCEYDIVSGTDSLFRAMLKQEGVCVLHPEFVDGDDAVVGVAHTADAFVLSRDGDMTRYHEFPTHRVLVDFAIDARGRLVFERRMRPPLEPRTARHLPETPTDFKSRPDWAGGVARLKQRLEKRPFLRRGNVDGLTRTHGNLCDSEVGRALRAASYAAMGVDAVDEEYPVYSSERRVASIKKTTMSARPNGTLISNLLDDPDVLLEQLARDQPNSRRHACAMTIAEWSAAVRSATGETVDEIDLLRTFTALTGLQDAQPSPLEPCEPWCTICKCEGLRHQPCSNDVFPSRASHAMGMDRTPKCGDCVAKLVLIGQRNAWKRDTG